MWIMKNSYLLYVIILLIMNEIIFDTEVKGESIYGIWHQPVIRKNVAVIFLHGWAGHRPGPHDMLVKLARCLCNTGYDCFRFDFRGKGYSQGDRHQTNNQTMLEDLDAVLRYVNNSLNNLTIVLIGICSGAKLAIYYARNGNYSISHVIEMSSPVLRQNEIRSQLMANNAKNTINEYYKKIFYKETWKKLISGDIHFSKIKRNIFKPLSQLIKLPYNVIAKATIDKTAEKEKSTGQKVKESPFCPFERFQGQMLLIHGEKDPETKLALQQIQDMLHRYEILSDTHIIKDANHSFYSLVWEKEIIQIVTNWLGCRV